MPDFTRRHALQVFATVTTASIAGCLTGDVSSPSTDGNGGSSHGDDGRNDESTGDGSPGNPAGEVDVSVVTRPSPAFEPGIVHVEPGGTVRWLVEGVRHNVTAYHPETYGPQRIPDGVDPFQSELLREGHEFAWTFDERGIYDYVDTRRLCGSHEALGAVGRVVVGWPDLEGQPANAHDVTELPSRAETVMEAYDERTREVLEAA